MDGQRAAVDGVVAVFVVVRDVSEALIHRRPAHDVPPLGEEHRPADAVGPLGDWPRTDDVAPVVANRLGVRQVIAVG